MPTRFERRPEIKDPYEPPPPDRFTRLVPRKNEGLFKALSDGLQVYIKTRETSLRIQLEDPKKDSQVVLEGIFSSIEEGLDRLSDAYADETIQVQSQSTPASPEGPVNSFLFAGGEISISGDRSGDLVATLIRDLPPRLFEEWGKSYRVTRVGRRTGRSRDPLEAVEEALTGQEKVFETICLRR